jgi:large subunit ribosomal protein L23
MAKSIIIKPLLTEKTNKLASNARLNQYTFVVDKSANKVEIAKAVEKQFGVTVLAVNTSIRPGKNKGRVIKGKMTNGITSSIKKAVVTIKEGEFIERFYGPSQVEENVETPTEEVNA